MSGLNLGYFVDQPELDLVVPVKQAAHHTAIIAQSGAGKSFLLGRLVEEIVTKTLSRVIVFDTNGDFRRVDSVSQKPWQPTQPRPLPEMEDRAGYAAFAHDWAKVQKRRLALSGSSDARISVHMGSMPIPDQAEVLHLSYLSDLDAIHLLGAEALSKRTPAQQAEWLRSLASPASRRLELAIANVKDWPIWGGTEEEQKMNSLLHRTSLGWDLLNVDWICSCPPDARTIAMCRILETVWERATDEWEKAVSSATDERTPTFVVIDEAHHFAGIQPRGPLASRLSESIHRIAAEGRKYGLYLILVTQRPSKIREGLLAECENACLMRLQSPVDHRAAADTWGVPIEHVSRCRYFSVGDALLCGRWVPSVSTIHSWHRRTEEGGASLRATVWAKARI